MHALIALHQRLAARIEAADALILGSLARFVFAAVLFTYYWASAKTKLGDGVFGFLTPSAGGFFQIFPARTDAVAGDVSQLGLFEHLVVIGATWAEFLLPVLIVAGLLTRLSALAMIGFVLVQSLTDIRGHGADASTIGAWFDRASGSLILDQRALWVLLLTVLAVKGAGPVSVDALLGRRAARPAYA